MKADDLFRHTLDELRTRVSGEPLQPYDAVMAGGLLRKLIADGANCLVGKVNHGPHRKKLVFRINRAIPPWETLGMAAQAFSFWSVGDALYPDPTFPGSRLVELKGIDQLLQEPMIWTKGQMVTVHGVIEQVANVAGGVHLGEPRRPPTELLTALAKELQVGGHEPAVQCIRGISLVVLEGLKTLRRSTA
jgi:hypothetical protein